MSAAVVLVDGPQQGRAGQFAPGSMLPKVQAALRFLEGGGRRAVITTPELSEKALAGEIGTQLTSSSP